MIQLSQTACDFRKPLYDEYFHEWPEYFLSLDPQDWGIGDFCE